MARSLDTAESPPKRVPYVDLGAQHRAMKEPLLAAVGRVLERGDFTLGEEVEEFEQRFARLCGTRHAVGLNSGTDALLLALRAMDLQPGDEVVTTANSFVASASAIALAGGRPVFVDIGRDGNLDPALLEGAVTPRTRAIMPVHLTGRPADMDAVCDVAGRHGLAVVEDAAQAVLARYRERPVGSFGFAGCFSLHPLKTLNACGDAGMLVTDDGDLAEEIRVLRNLGQRRRSEAVAWSGNSRLDTVQAAMLLVKLEYVEEWTECRREHAAAYREGLAGLPGIEVPEDRQWEYAVYHTFVVQCDRRDDLRTHLADRGIRTAIHYPTPIHLQPVGRELGHRPGDLPETERQSGRILSIPVHAEMTTEQRTHVISSIRAFAEGAD